ncbi:hypothetical protein [Aquabacterium sp.]|uniref:hypothetical protein n=1 Tax=Aquabacterium sp. TaxID=1872578 RepID=UPI003D6C92AB
MKPISRFAGLAAALLLLIGGHASAAEFHLYLNCKGKLSAGGKGKAATLDLAMRDNNTTALIQKSNVLPVGERLRYKASQVSYTMLYKLPLPGTVYYNDWVRGQWIVWQPNLKKLATIRLSIDRQSGELEGELLDHDDNLLGNLEMECEPQSMDEVPEPRF